MSRGGRGGGRGGKRGPDMSWDDEESTEPTVNTRKPGPLFPERYLPGPKPLTPTEKAHIQTYIDLRNHMRQGPLYTMLDPTLTPKPSAVSSSLSKMYQQSITAKPNPRAGFDPFNDQENHTNKNHRKRRFFPDLSGREGYTLSLFPRELWPVLDPKQRMEEWTKLTDEEKTRLLAGSGSGSRTKKRKRAEAALKFDDDAITATRGPRDSDASDENEDEDALSPSALRRKKTSAQDRRKRADDAKSAARQKKGLDAEDDYPDVDQQDEDGEGGGPGGAGAGGAEDEPVDSEFGTDEDDDDGGDDYNAEQYFDDGGDEADFGGDGDDDDGGGGGGGFY